MNASFSLLSAGATGFGRGGVIPAATKGKEGSWDFNPRTQVRYDAELRVGMPLMLARTPGVPMGDTTARPNCENHQRDFHHFVRSNLHISLSLECSIQSCSSLAGALPGLQDLYKRHSSWPHDSLSGIRVEHMKVFKESYKAYKGVKISSKGTIEWRL